MILLVKYGNAALTWDPGISDSAFCVRVRACALARACVDQISIPILAIIVNKVQREQSSLVES